MFTEIYCDSRFNGDKSLFAINFKDVRKSMLYK